MCDMCGVVSSNMAAKVHIELSASLQYEFRSRVTNNADYLPHRDAIVRDVCSDCLGNFFQERKVLTAHPFKDEPTEAK